MFHHMFGMNVNCWFLLVFFYDMLESPCPVAIEDNGYDVGIAVVPF